MKLYYNPISPNCRRVTMTAAYLGIPLEEIAVDVVKGESRTPEYLAMNPNGMVPTLVDGDFTLWESRAIIEYLADKVPSARLGATNERERVDISRWLFWDAAHLSRHAGTILFEKFIKGRLNMGAPDAVVILAATEQLKRFLGVLDKSLAGKKYLVGSRLTIADLALACEFTYRDILGVPLDPYPNVKSWLSRIEELDCWKATEPPVRAAAE